MQVTRNPNRGVELGYAEITTSFAGTTASTTDQDVTGLSVTVTVGSRPIEIIVSAGRFSNDSTGGTSVKIKEGATTLGVMQNASGAGVNVPCFRRIRLNPSAGSHTYKLTIACIGAAGTPTLVALATDPASISVCEV